MRICAIGEIDGVTNGKIAFVPQHHFSLFEDRNTQIALGELLGVILIIREDGQSLSNRPATIFGDHMGVVATVGNGGGPF